MRKLIFLFVLAFTGYALQAQVTFKASAPQAVVTGQQFQLTYTVNAEASARDLRVPELADFDVLYGPSTSTSASTEIYSNGQIAVQTTNTFTYTLLAKKEGTFNIAPATIRAKGANYTSNALVVKVLPQDQQDAAGRAAAPNGEATTSGSSVPKDAIYVKMLVSKNNVYEQEGFLLTFKLFSLYNAGLPEIKFPEFEGFLAQDIEIPQPQWTLENINGRNYRTVVFKQVILYPQRSGKLTISGGRFLATIQMPTPHRVRSFFDDFYDAIQEVNKELVPAPVTIQVKPLPSGKSASFSGAVGQFDMSASISADRVKANESVTVKVKIAGNGNIKLVKNPEVKFPNDFYIFDPKVETDIKTTAAGTHGTKTIEYLAIPRFAGDFTIPVIEFSYFDPKTEKYTTLTAGPYPLQVEKGEGGEAANNPVVSDFSNKENVKYLGKDIRYLKVKGVHFAPKNELFFGSFIYIMCYLIPLLLFVLFFIVYRKQVKENANIALVRTKKANKIAVRRLKAAGKLLKEDKKEAFYDEVLRAVWGYLSDKLNIPQAMLTKDNVETELIRYGVDESLIGEFMDVLNTCEFARYAPAQAPDAMDKLYELTVDAIGKMENTIKKK
ncbi:MAG: BatD family protein [Parabacteroides sp.]|nr:BatD family protein [Parabacteroides sp.]